VAGSAVVATCAVCASGQKVGYIGNNSGTLTFQSVPVNTAGTYRLAISYLAGEARNMTVRVNGGSAINVAFASSGGWDQKATQTVDIPLAAGSNTLQFSNPTGWAPDIDQVSLNGPL